MGSVDVTDSKPAIQNRMHWLALHLPGVSQHSRLQALSTAPTRLSLLRLKHGPVYPEQTQADQVQLPL